MKLHAIVSNHDKIEFKCCPTCGYLVRTTTENERKKMIKKIIDTVTRYCDVEYDVCCRKSRRREIVLTRQLIYYFIKDRLKNKMSLKSMGWIFKLDQDHTTVLHSINTIKDLMFSDSVLRRDVEIINLKLDEILGVHNVLELNVPLLYDTK